MSLTQAGWGPPIRGPPARLFGSSGRRFPPRFDAGREISSVAMHVESCGDVLPDAGSTPAASTITRFARSGVGAVVRQVAPAFGLANMLDSRRLHSTRPQAGESNALSEGAKRLSRRAASLMASPAQKLSPRPERGLSFWP
jgi:hypothetical protein